MEYLSFITFLIGLAFGAWQHYRVKKLEKELDEFRTDFYQQRFFANRLAAYSAGTDIEMWREGSLN